MTRPVWQPVERAALYKRTTRLGQALERAAIIEQLRLHVSGKPSNMPAISADKTTRLGQALERAARRMVEDFTVHSSGKPSNMHCKKNVRTYND